MHTDHKPNHIHNKLSTIPINKLNKHTHQKIEFTCSELLEYESGYCPTLIKFKEYDSGCYPTLMKLKGLSMYISL